MRRAALLALLLLGGCRVSFSPLQNRIAFGEEAFAVFVARGEGGAGDLYAVRGQGGEIWPVTYTRTAERLPALAADGRRLAFVRARPDGRDRLVVLDLPSGRERVAFEGAAAGDSVTAVAWEAGVLRFRAAGAAWRVDGDAPAQEAPEPAGGFAPVLGRPGFAVVVPCEGGGLCVRPLAGGAEAPLDADGRDATAWGADSVGYFVADEFLVRPLAAGRARTVRWHPAPVAPHSPTAFAP